MCLRPYKPSFPQDVLARFKESHNNFDELPSKAVFQMNDTHPTIAVAELMRLLLDQEGLDWDRAWKITTQVGLRRRLRRERSSPAATVVICSSIPQCQVPAVVMCKQMIGAIENCIEMTRRQAEEKNIHAGQNGAANARQCACRQAQNEGLEMLIHRLT